MEQLFWVLISFVLKQKKQKFKTWNSPLKISPVL